MNKMENKSAYSTDRIIERLADEILVRLKNNTRLDEQFVRRITEVATLIKMSYRDVELIWELRMSSHNIGALGEMICDELSRPTVPARISYATAALLVGRGETFLRDFVQKGELPVYAQERRRLFDPNDLEALLRRHYTGDEHTIVDMLMEPKYRYLSHIPRDVFLALMSDGRIPHVFGNVFLKDIHKLNAEWMSFERVLISPKD